MAATTSFHAEKVLPLGECTCSVCRLPTSNSVYSSWSTVHLSLLFIQHTFAGITTRKQLGKELFVVFMLFVNKFNMQPKLYTKCSIYYLCHSTGIL